MKYKQLSCDALSKESGVPADRISQYSTDIKSTADIDDRDAEKLSKALGVNKNELIDPKSDMLFVVSADDDLREALKSQMKDATARLEHKAAEYISAEKLINALTDLQNQICKRQQKIVDTYYEVVRTYCDALGDAKIRILLPDLELSEDALKLSGKLMRAYMKQ